MLKNKGSILVVALLMVYAMTGTVFGSEGVSVGSLSSQSVSAAQSSEKTSVTNTAGDTGSNTSDRGTPSPEPPKTETPNSGTPSPEPPKTETPNSGTPSTEPPKTETPDSGTPSTEPPKTETPDSGTPSTEPPKTETPDSEIPSTEPPTSEVPEDGIDPGFSVNVEEPKVEIPEAEIPLPEEILPVVQPEESTLKIHHSFEYKGVVCDDYETVEGLVAGSTINLGAYSYEGEHEFARCLNGDVAFVLEAGENTITIKYTLKQGFKIVD